jgi:hypothetical protein
MPWAHEAESVQFTFAKRTSVVCTHIVQAIELIIDPHDNDKTIVEFEA